MTFDHEKFRHELNSEALGCISQAHKKLTEADALLMRNYPRKHFVKFLISQARHETESLEEWLKRTPPNQKESRTE